MTEAQAPGWCHQQAGWGQENKETSTRELLNQAPTGGNQSSCAVHTLMPPVPQECMRRV